MTRHRLVGLGFDELSRSPVAVSHFWAGSDLLQSAAWIVDT